MRGFGNRRGLLYHCDEVGIDTISQHLEVSRAGLAFVFLNQIYDVIITINYSSNPVVCGSCAFCIAEINLGNNLGNIFVCDNQCILYTSRRDRNCSIGNGDGRFFANHFLNALEHSSKFAAVIDSCKVAFYMNGFVNQVC